MDNKPNLAKAVIAVMKSVKGIDKTMTIGSGNNSYKGVPDQEVKKVIGDSMAANGLTILPIGVDARTQIDRWEEVDPYSKSTPKDMKTKQSVFTEVTTKYLLLHESGESIELSGYGHGIDTQDKGAGKATTYALKYTLLYTFLVPTGKIDDTGATHSNDMDTPARNMQTSEAEKTQRDLNSHIAKLANCNSVDELKTLKSILPEWVLKTKQFNNAATERFLQVKEKDLQLSLSSMV